MRKVYVIGGAVTKFGKHWDRNLKSLAGEAVTGALQDAGITKAQLQGAWVGNGAQGILQGQEGIRGQIVLRELGIGRIPVVNVENACASSATALNGAIAMIKSGEIDVALVLGMEKMYFQDRSIVLKAFMGGMDVEIMEQLKAAFKADEERVNRQREAAGGTEAKEKSGERTVFMDAYAMGARQHMERYGTTQRELAAISSKNHFHSSMNPLAQYQTKFTIEEVLAAPEVTYPLTRPMCAPIGDGAAAAIVCAEDFVKKTGASRPVEIAACLLASGEDRKPGEPSGIARLARLAYERAGIGPEDISLAEVHDATAFGELAAVEQLGFCPEGEGGRFAEAGHTTLGGKIPVNVSGGLESQGHPVGATGIRQVMEICWHLTGRAGARQVAGAKAGIAENAGGAVRGGEAALSVTILRI